MSSIVHRHRTFLAVALLALSWLALAGAPQASAASGLDLRSPDARDAATATQPTSSAAVDLRSPDARDAGTPTKPTTPAPNTVPVDPGGPGFALIAGLALAGMAGASMAVALRRRRRFVRPVVGG